MPVKIILKIIIRINSLFEGILVFNINDKKNNDKNNIILFLKIL